MEHVESQGNCIRVVCPLVLLAGDVHDLGRRRVSGQTKRDAALDRGLRWVELVKDRDRADGCELLALENNTLPGDDVASRAVGWWATERVDSNLDGDVPVHRARYDKIACGSVEETEEHDNVRVATFEMSTLFVFVLKLPTDGLVTIPAHVLGTTLSVDRGSGWRHGPSKFGHLIHDGPGGRLHPKVGVALTSVVRWRVLEREVASGKVLGEESFGFGRILHQWWPLTR